MEAKNRKKRKSKSENNMNVRNFFLPKCLFFGPSNSNKMVVQIFNLILLFNVVTY